MSNSDMMNVLVVIDVQNCFMFHSGGMDPNKGGTFLNAGEQASKEIVDELNTLVQDKTHIVFSRDFHPVNHISLEGYESRNIDPDKGIWPKHCRNKTLRCKSRSEGVDAETPDTIIANRVVDTTKGELVDGIKADGNQFLEVIGTELSYMFFRSDIFREPVKQLIIGNKQGLNKIGLYDTTLESGYLKVIDKPDEQRKINYGESISIEGKQYISLTKGERCDKEAYSAFNYHIQYEPATPYEPNNTLKVNIPPSKENSTGLWEWILTTARTNEKKKITITVCGLVGNVCVMHSLLQGIALWNNVYSKEYTDIAVKFVYSMQGTRFAELVPPMKIKPSFVDDKVVDHFNKNIPRGIGQISITDDAAVEPKAGQIESFEVLNEAGNFKTTVVGSISPAIPKIIMFSDMEGCMAKPDAPQSTFLCSTPFYEEIDRRLEADQNLEVAFLGDYFDQGLGVFNSIDQMHKLLLGRNKERVHVILGNRDVNKLRFMFELEYTPRGLSDKEDRWDAWADNGYYDGLSGKTGVDLVKHMLPKSFGASNNIDGKMVGLHSFVPVGEGNNVDDKTALEYLKASFGMTKSPNTKLPPLDLLDFFFKCKIAHVFNGKVLLAHGGGFDPEAFFNKEYIESFKTYEPVTSYNYHKMLNAFRVRLSSTDDMSSYTTSVQDSVDAYNSFLKEVITELKENKDKNRFTWKFVLLQALGLKPNARDKSQDARFKSLIQSCSQDGCKGPNVSLRSDPIDETTKITKLAKILKDSGITHVSYGHKPICFPIPVIYRREEVPGVTFISNDTSNGNRKVEEVGNNTAIGTMVIFGPRDVTSQIERIELNGIEAKVGDYSEMYKPLTFDQTPLYKKDGPTGPYFLQYGNKRVVFNKDGHNQLAYVDSEQPLASSGGKRRSQRRNQHKSKRNSKRRGYNKTRHNKHKQTKHGRKSRRY